MKKLILIATYNEIDNIGLLFFKFSYKDNSWSILLASIVIPKLFLFID